MQFLYSDLNVIASFTMQVGVFKKKRKSISIYINVYSNSSFQ